MMPRLLKLTKTKLLSVKCAKVVQNASGANTFSVRTEPLIHLNTSQYSIKMMFYCQKVTVFKKKSSMFLVGGC